MVPFISFHFSEREAQQSFGMGDALQALRAILGDPVDTDQLKQLLAKVNDDVAGAVNLYYDQKSAVPAAPSAPSASKRGASGVLDFDSKRPRGSTASTSTAAKPKAARGAQMSLSSLGAVLGL